MDDLRTLQLALVDLGRAMHRIKLQISQQGGPHQSAVPILGRLRLHGPMRQAGLASSCGLDPSTVSRQVDALVRTGLVLRAADPDDGRATRLELTEAGVAALEDFDSRIAAVLDDVVGHWSPEQLRQLSGLLHRFSDDAADRLQGPRTSPNGAAPDRRATDSA